MVGDNFDIIIIIYEFIGYDWWIGEGVIVKCIVGVLCVIGGDVDVIVNINSLGGDVFEGLVIYNLLCEYKGKVMVNIIGLVVFVVFFIVMVGDEICIGCVVFLMIYNVWLIVMGNWNDLCEIVDWLELFDMMLVDIYV